MFLPPFGGPVECAVPDATRQEFRHAFLAGVIIEAVGIALSDGPALIGAPGRTIVAARVPDRDEAVIGIQGIALPDVPIDSSAIQQVVRRGRSLFPPPPCSTVAGLAALFALHGIDDT